MGDMSKDEEIGFHKGSLATLINERKELMRMVAVVDQLIQAHAKALEDAGVKLQKAPAKEDMDEKLEKLLEES